MSTLLHDFFDLPNLVHKWGYLVIIYLDIHWCVFHILSKFFSPFMFGFVIVRRRPSWSITSLPNMLIVLLSTNSIMHFFALEESDVMSTLIIPVTSTLLLLKHLNTPIDLFGSWMIVFSFTSSLCAVSVFMKLRGLQVSANQSTYWLFVLVLIQNSPLFVLLMSFSFLKFTDLMKFTYSMISVLHDLSYVAC